MNKSILNPHHHLLSNAFVVKTFQTVKIADEEIIYAQKTKKVSGMVKSTFSPCIRVSAQIYRRRLYTYLPIKLMFRVEPVQYFLFYILLYIFFYLTLKLRYLLFCTYTISFFVCSV